jgi:[protein-PII] uridylyltransferase
LYYATQRVLQNETFSLQQAIDARKNDAAARLAKYGLQGSAYNDLWQNVGENYFARFESEEIAWQSRLLTPHVFTDKPIVRARLSPNGDGIQVMIYSKDQDDLFARICNFFDRMAYNIVEAKIYTTQHSFALNSFSVLDQSGKSVSYSGLLKFIEAQLTEKIITPDIETPLEGRISRQIKHMPYATQVNIHADSQGIYHTLEIVAGDRPGLLAKIAFTFLQLGVDLHNAKINTLGSRAEDSFLISAKQQSLNAAQIDALRDNLVKL